MSFGECQALARYLGRLSARANEAVVLAGNFNIRRADSPAVDAFSSEGISIPPKTLHPSSATGKHYFSLIGVLDPKDDESERLRAASSGTFNPLQHVYREEDAGLYSNEDLQYGRNPATRGRSPRYGRMWRTMQLSDHVPLWVELETPLETAPRE